MVLNINVTFILKTIFFVMYFSLWTANILTLIDEINHNTFWTFYCNLLLLFADVPFFLELCSFSSKIGCRHGQFVKPFTFQSFISAVPETFPLVLAMENISLNLLLR